MAERVYYCGTGTLQFGHPDATGRCIECGKTREEHREVVEMSPEEYEGLRGRVRVLDELKAPSSEDEPRRRAIVPDGMTLEEAMRAAPPTWPFGGRVFPADMTLPSEEPCPHPVTFDSLPAVCQECGAIEGEPEWDVRRKAYLAVMSDHSGCEDK